MATMMCRALGFDINGDWAGNAAAAYMVFTDVPEDYWAGRHRNGGLPRSHVRRCNGCFRPRRAPRGLKLSR
jgi:hypothetical protein